MLPVGIVSKETELLNWDSIIDRKGEENDANHHQCG